MANIPKKVEQRIKEHTKNYAKILEQVRSRDINESDTVKIVADMLADIFGYDKYLDITSEYSIRNTFCDLAIKQNGEVIYLIECKAIGIQLKDDHLRQAVEYSATKGIDWAILTNGQTWKIHKVIYGKPIRTEEIFTLDFINESTKSSDFTEKIFMLTKEAISKSVIEAYHEHSKLINKFSIAAILLTDEVAGLIRKTLRTMSKQTKVDLETIKDIIADQVIKRDLMDSEEMKNSLAKFKRQLRRQSANKRTQPDSLDTKALSDNVALQNGDVEDIEDDLSDNKATETSEMV